jgi:hypothetical protein
MSPETQARVYSKADYILYSLENYGYSIPSLDNAMNYIRQIADGPLVDAASAEWDLWMEDSRRFYQAIHAWDDATVGPILRAARLGVPLAIDAVPDSKFTDFRATPEGACLYNAMQNARAIARASEERLKNALRELVAATAPPDS